MLTDYFTASIPEPWQVLGVKLKPFSLGHYLKLKRLNSPFVSDEPATADLGDLILAVIICSMSSHLDPARDEFWSWWNRPTRFNLWAWMFRKEPLTPAENEVYRFGRKVGKFDLESKIKLFSEYIKHHSAEPGYWVLREQDGENKQGAHWAHGVISILVSECNYTQSDALNAPLPKAFQDYYRRLEIDGAVRLMTDQEREALAV